MKPAYYLLTVAAMSLTRVALADLTVNAQSNVGGSLQGDAITFTAPVVADTFLFMAQPNMAFGDQSIVTDGGTSEIADFVFDFSEIPPGAIIQSAHYTFTLANPTTNLSTIPSVSLAALGYHVDEDSTYNSVGTVKKETAILGTVSHTDGTFVTIDGGTSYIQGIVNGTTVNNGVHLVQAKLSNGVTPTINYDSLQSDNPSFVTIIYTIPETNTVGLLLAGFGALTAFTRPRKNTGSINLIDITPAVTGLEGFRKHLKRHENTPVSHHDTASTAYARTEPKPLTSLVTKQNGGYIANNPGSEGHQQAIEEAELATVISR